MNISILQVFCAVFSGIIQGTAISNSLSHLGQPFFALFALAPLYLALYTSKSYRRAGLLFMVQIFTVHMISSFWLANYHEFGFITLGASAFGTALKGFLCGIIAFLYPSTLVKNQGALKEMEENSGKRPFEPFKRTLWFASAWLVWEWVKSTGFLGYPWGTIFSAAYRWKIITQIASVTGVWGITFIFALFSALCGEGLLLLRKSIQNQKAVSSNYRQLAFFTFTVFSVVFVYGLLAYITPMNRTKSLKTIIVQQNIDPWEAVDNDAIVKSIKLTRNELEKYKENESPDLIVWSEGVLPRAFPKARTYYETHPEPLSLSDFIASTNTPFIIGGRTLINKNKKYYNNSAFLFDAAGRFTGNYGKIHLVPFAEGFPFENNPTMKAFLKNIVPFVPSYRKGKQLVLFQIPIKRYQDEETPLEYRNDLLRTVTLDEEGRGSRDDQFYFSENTERNPEGYVSFTTPICFVDSFNDVCRPLWLLGSEVFVNITNDSWSKTAVAEYQHFIIASYRAIEYRTTLVRACNSGYSAVVDPKGNIIADLPVFQDASATIDIPVYERRMTPYAKYGDWFVYLILISMSIYGVYFFIVNWKWPERRRRHFITITFQTCINECQENLETEKEEVSEKNSSSEKTVKRVSKTSAGSKSAKKTAEKKSGKAETKITKKTAGRTVKKDSEKSKKKTMSSKTKTDSSKKRGIKSSRKKSLSE